MINKATLGLVMCLAGAILFAQSRLAAQIGAGVDASLARNGVDSAAGRADVVVRWNELAHDIAFAADQFRTLKCQRALAVMHLAIHARSLTCRLCRYVSGDRPDCSPVEAAAQWLPARGVIPPADSTDAEPIVWLNLRRL